MIRLIRELAANLQPDADLQEASLPPDRGEAEIEADPGLDILLRNAVSNENANHDARHVWQQLSRRVRGPFGSIAVEEPALRGETMPIDAFGGSGADAPPETIRHSFFRFADSTSNMR